MNLSPNDFNKFPWSSVMNKTEAEIVARNIMCILGRTGNEWRELTWKEYVDERMKDGDRRSYVDNEREFFSEVCAYTVNAKQAAKFSPTWSAINALP